MIDKSKFAVPLVVGALLCCYCGIAQGIDVSVQTELVAENPGPAVADYHGWDLALDGDIAAVSAAYNVSATETGYGHIYVRSAGSWSHEATLVPAAAVGGDYVGCGVGISGNRVILGNRDAGGGAGSAVIFERTTPGGVPTWTETTTLTGSGTTSRFGNAAEIDGDAVVIGEYNSSRVWASQYSGGVWSNPVILTGATSDTGRLGYDADIEEGKWIVGGAFTGNAVHIWKWNGGASTWDYHSKLDNGTVDGYFGIACDVDDDKIIVGARAAHSSDGEAYIYKYDSGSDTWGLEQTLLSNQTGELFGCGVRLDGDYAVVGAYDSDVTVGEDTFEDAGAAYVYEQVSPGNWAKVATLVPDTPTTEQTMGNSVGVSGDTFLVGGPCRSTKAIPGKTFVFEPIPEPGLTVLLAGALLSLLFAGWARRR